MRAAVRLEAAGDALNVGSMVNNNIVNIYSGAKLTLTGNLTDNGTITVNGGTGGLP